LVTALPDSLRRKCGSPVPAEGALHLTYEVGPTGWLVLLVLTLREDRVWHRTGLLSYVTLGRLKLHADGVLTGL